MDQGSSRSQRGTVLLVSLLAIFGCRALTGSSNQLVTPRGDLVSLVRLVAVPEEYHGRDVMTIGVLEIEGRDSWLYLSGADQENGIISNAIAIEFGDGWANREYAQGFNRRYVSLRGTFSTNTNRYRRLPAGVLTEVVEIYGPDDIRPPAAGIR